MVIQNEIKSMLDLIRESSDSIIDGDEKLAIFILGKIEGKLENILENL